MAVIRGFRHEVKGRGTRQPTDVDGLYFDFLDDQGAQILQLSTLGSEHRQSQPKVSQTFQIGREGAAELRSILEQTFAGIAGEQLASLTSSDGMPSPTASEPEEPIERFIVRARLTRTEEIGVDGT